MTDQQQRTEWALNLVDGFIASWTPPAMHAHLMDSDNNQAQQLRRAIAAIAPKPDTERHIGWAVFQRDIDRDYDRERPSGLVHTPVSAVFEFVPTNALDYCRAKREGDFVICEIQEIP